jgi:hypothetical protein
LLDSVLESWPGGDRCDANSFVPARTRWLKGHQATPTCGRRSLLIALVRLSSSRQSRTFADSAFLRRSPPSSLRILGPDAESCPRPSQEVVDDTPIGPFASTPYPSRQSTAGTDAKRRCCAVTRRRQLSSR